MNTALIPVGPEGAPHYRVDIAAGLLSRLGEALDTHGVGPHRILASTPPVWRIVAPMLPPALRSSTPILLPDGERFKTLSTVARVFDALVKAEADRASTLVAIGGGVLGDTAGFAAATFLRGIALVQVPTTLLAQVDSAIGGKVGVNHALGKNLIGAFHRPRAVLIDPLVLESLPRRDFRAGLYEVVKYGAIASADLFTRLEEQLSQLFARNPEVLVPTIADCCAIKARVVTSDERESAERRILNFGHTVGHALEAITDYRHFLHGEAVAYGMTAATALAAARGTIARDERERLSRLIVKMGPLPPVGDLSAHDALRAIRRDKKVLHRRLHFVLPTRIGEVTIADDVRESELAAALREIGLKE